MNLNDLPSQAVQAEQSVIGALLLENDALDRIGDLTAAHFYRHEHRAYFAEICRQVATGKRCDVITMSDALQSDFVDCMTYLNGVAQNTPSSANIARYADMVIESAIKRALVALGGEIQDITAAPQSAGACVDIIAAKLEALAKRKTKQEPMRIADMMGNYVDVIQQRMDGKIKPIETGFKDLDSRLDGGLERGTLTVVAGRPGTGKTALGLCFARNASEWGTSLFLSMEMARDQVNDRNIAALGHIPISWLRRPCDKSADGKLMFDKMSSAFARVSEMNLYIDDQTSLNMLDIRSKSRTVKRKNGLDLLVIDQLSFITGGTSDKSWEVVGEYTRGMLQLAKELNIAIVLLCQLNRKCEERQNKRPMMSDLAVSGSIEQDAANILFLYRDELYNPDSKDKGICEVATAKQRQGEPGIVALTYIGNQTRFEDLAYQWEPPKMREVVKSRGFD